MRDFRPLKLLKRNEVIVGPVNPISCLATNWCSFSRFSMNISVCEVMNVRRIM